MTIEIAIIAWLYAFGAAATAAAFVKVTRADPDPALFFVAAMWPILVPLMVTVSAIRDQFD